MNAFELKTGAKSKKDMAEFNSFIPPVKFFTLGEPDVNVALSDKRYLQIQDCSEGFDWTLFDENMNIIDGGQTDECESLSDMFFVLAAEYGFEKAEVHYLDEWLEEGMDPPDVFKKDKARWKIWFQIFDEKGEQTGAGVMPRTYAHKSSAMRRVKKLPQSSRKRYIVSVTNPFI